MRLFQPITRRPAEPPIPLPQYFKASPQKLSSRLILLDQSNIENMNESPYLHRNASAKLFHTTTSHHLYDIATNPEQD